MSADFDPREITRRRFVIGAALGAGGILLARGLAGGADEVFAAEGRGGADPFFAHLQIEADGTVIITCPQAEIGQGVYDSLAMIVADELDADWSRVRVRTAWAESALANPINKRQRIGGSDSVMTFRDGLRTVGAAAREMLIATAAERWSVPMAHCRCEQSRVVHDASNRAFHFGELAADAARRPVPATPALKPASALRLTGRRHVRKDTPAKIDGSAEFGVDVRRGVTVFAALRRANAIDARLVRHDPKSVSTMPGVVAVVPLDDAVAVVADSWWRAHRAAEALVVEFDESNVRGLSTAGIEATLRATLRDDARALEWPRIDRSVQPPRRIKADRVALEATFARRDAKQLDVTYEVPHLAHMTMEPQCCAVRVSADRCEVWAPLQQPDYARDLAATLTNLPADKVRVETTFGGGGFGRRWELDALRQAVLIARELPGRTVNLIWSREQDMRHDFYRPAHMARYRAAIDREGRLLALHGRTAGQSLLAYKGLRKDMTLPDVGATAGLLLDEYRVPLRLLEGVDAQLPIPIGFWRSVGASQNGFFCESVLDEIAHAAGRDPYELRRELLADEPRVRAVLERAAEASDWHRPLPKGRGRGIALNTGFGGICAQVFEVSVRGSKVVIHRVVCVYDCGLVLNPSIVESQLEGGIAFGLSAAIYGGLHFERGAVVESNFQDQTFVRSHEMPKVETHLIASDERAGGVGEASVPPAAPALVNAIFAASGRRYRRLPLRDFGLEIGAG